MLRSRGLVLAGIAPRMLQHSSCVALALMLVGLSTALAADTTLTLACQGTATSGLVDAKPGPISMGIIVNFTDQTLTAGFMPRLGSFGEIKIGPVNETTVGFAGMNKSGEGLSGSIDRVV